MIYCFKILAIDITVQQIVIYVKYKSECIIFKFYHSAVYPLYILSSCKDKTSYMLGLKTQPQRGILSLKHHRG